MKSFVSPTFRHVATALFLLGGLTNSCVYVAFDRHAQRMISNTSSRRVPFNVAFAATEEVIACADQHEARDTASNAFRQLQKEMMRVECTAAKIQDPWGNFDGLSGTNSLQEERSHIDDAAADDVEKLNEVASSWAC